jgi:hypothetical protein
MRTLPDEGFQLVLPLFEKVRGRAQPVIVNVEITSSFVPSNPSKLHHKIQHSPSSSPPSLAVRQSKDNSARPANV